mmetsp:Transcript_13752/g.29584  ORF Transcript_13752/g.29584 Transcript_13752/m.29584 type:complete len:232 (+) Transcript_13752:149-844(+)
MHTAHRGRMQSTSTSQAYRPHPCHSPPYTPRPMRSRLTRHCMLNYCPPPVARCHHEHSYTVSAGYAMSGHVPSISAWPTQKHLHVLAHAHMHVFRPASATLSCCQHISTPTARPVLTSVPLQQLSAVALYFNSVRLGLATPPSSGSAHCFQEYVMKRLPASKVSSRALCSLDSLHLNASSMFCLRCSGLEALGMTGMPRCIFHLSSTCAGDLPASWATLATSVLLIRSFCT